jgi:HK97 family phage major capsid protein
MSIAAFESYLTDELTACVMECIADALVNGDGSGQGTGLEEGVTWVKTAGSTQNAIEVAADAPFTYHHIVGVASLLKRGYAQGAKWAMNNKTLYNVFFTMSDSNAQPIFVAKTLGEAKAGDVGRILGFDVVIDDNIADDVIYLGNYKKYMGYNMPECIIIEMSKDSGFRKGLIDYRAMAIADCKPIVADAFVKLYRAAE